MIQRIGIGSSIADKQRKVTIPVSNINNGTKYTNHEYNYTSEKLLNALQAFYNIQTSKTVSFGKSLSETFEELNQPMITCRDLSKGKEGEVVGHRVPVHELIDEFSESLPHTYDAIKTNIEISSTKDSVTEARTQLKNTPEGMLYEVKVTPERLKTEPYTLTEKLPQVLRVKQDANIDERPFILNTNGKLMIVLEDGKNVLLTNAGTVIKKSGKHDRLTMEAIQENNNFIPFTPKIQKVEQKIPQESEGVGTEIIIGMEDGRFVPEIIDSIKSFTDKVNNGEIVLDKFVASPNAKNTQLVMLAGGFGSRAEYTNASSDGIFHSKEKGAQSTKGIFKTATGFTPMETTFISLHNAGLLDCSKGKLEIGDNIKFYLNKSGVNKDNGGFTLDLADLTERSGRKNITILPNDSMSRLTNAYKEAMKLTNSGKAAVAMIAKEVKSEDAKGNFGIMKLGEDNEILEFAEKPKVIPEGYEKDGKCLTNTFQFQVSNEAIEALRNLEPYFPYSKDARDWSKSFIPILMALTTKDDIQEIRNVIEKTIPNLIPGSIPDGVIEYSKAMLEGQKVYAIPTDEPWADCGTLNALYHTTMQIANGDFPLEDFERQNVLSCTNTQTGLVASSPIQKSIIEGKYIINGEVMAVPKAKKVNPEIVDDYINQGLIIINE